MVVIELILSVASMKQTHGLVSTGKVAPVCEPFRTFKSKFIQDCTSFATPKLIHLTTPGFSDYYKGNIWVTWKIRTKSVLAPIRLVIEVVDLPCEAGYLQISEGEAKSQKICGVDERWPNLVGTAPEMVLNLLTFQAATEFRLKIAYMSQDSKCGKMVKNYPRSIDPCVQKELAQKRENALLAVQKLTPRTSSGKIISKHVQLKSAEKKALPPSAFDMLGKAADNSSDVSIKPVGVTRSPTVRTFRTQSTRFYVEPIENTADLVAFREELDRRYWNLDKLDEADSPPQPGLAWLAALVIIAILLALAALGRYYYLRFKRLKETEYTIKEGNIKVELKKMKKKAPSK